MTETLKEFNFISVCVRLLLAVVSGAVLGFGRARKKQSAGLRTYIVTCVGAALTALIAYYEFEMLQGGWLKDVIADPAKFDGSRFSATVISGIGFLAAGSIMLIRHQQISGLTTAIGLFVTACVGICAGMGFYEVVLVAVVLIFFVMEGMKSLEVAFKRKMRHMTIHVNFDDLEHIDAVTDAVKGEGATIYEFEVEDVGANSGAPSVIVYVKLAKHNPSHSAVLSAIAEVPCVNGVQELIS